MKEEILEAGPGLSKPFMEMKAAANRLATTSLVLALFGWVFYLLQWCFDLSLGLVLAAATGGSSALCATVLDVLPFFLWTAGAISGHVALGQIRRSSLPGCGRAVWGLVLNYLGLFFTILLILLVIILLVAGIHTGWFHKILPFLHK